MSILGINLKVVKETMIEMRKGMKNIYATKEEEFVEQEKIRFEELNDEKQENDRIVEMKLKEIEEKQVILKEDEPELHRLQLEFEEAKRKLQEKEEERKAIAVSIKETQNSVVYIKKKQRKIDEEQEKILRLVEENEKKKRVELNQNVTRTLSTNPQYIGLELKEQLVENYHYCIQEEVRNAFTVDGDKITFSYSYLPDVTYHFVWSLESSKIDLFVETNNHKTQVATNALGRRKNYFVGMNPDGTPSQEENQEIRELVEDVIRYLKEQMLEASNY